MSTINFRVRYQETDQMGVVHHSVYYIWYEMGRTEWMREQGLTYRDCENNGWLLPVVESGTTYKSPARYDDLISVETSLVLNEGIKFHFDYIVKNVETNQILAKGFTEHVCIDKNQRINKEITKLLKERLSLKK